MSENWALNQEGRLYIPGLTPESISYDIYDRSASSWYLDSETNKISADIIPDAAQSSSPFPMGVWYMQPNHILCAGGIPSRIYGQYEYPEGVWYLKSTGQAHAGGMPFAVEWEEDYLPNIFYISTGNKPSMDLYQDLPALGAFANATNLEEITIPETCESIGKESFLNTSLTAVTLPQNCTYYSTSFPPDCVVTGGQLIPNA